MNQQNSDAPEQRYGWVMVGVAALILGLANGSILSISVYLKPLAEEFGWLRGTISGGFVAATIALGFGGIGAGWLADRFSARPVVLAGVVALGGSYFLLGTLDTPGEFYLYFSLMGGVGVAGVFAPLLANVGGWFSKNMGLALGVTTAGQALGQGFVPYFARLLISDLGWRGAYTTLGFVSLAVLIPLALLVRSPPRPAKSAVPSAPLPPAEAGAAAKAAEVAPAVAERQFPVAPRLAVAWVTAAALFCCICMAVPLIHVVALAQDKGIPGNLAASILLPIYITGFFGRIFFGKVADRLGGIRAYWIASAGQTATVFWFTQPDSLTGFYLLGPLYGFFFSGVMTCFIICVNEMTPFRIRGISNGIVMLSAWIGMGLGGFQAGLFFDLTGSYTLSFANAAIAGVINLTIVGALYFYHTKQEAAVPAEAPA
ncbi:MAG: MFS transporter [bacterium]